jgi:HD-like signal output (HDOD) protein
VVAFSLHLKYSTEAGVVKRESADFLAWFFSRKFLDAGRLCAIVKV